MFRYDDPLLNFLYMNGVIGIEYAPDELYVRFPCSFVQKRLFYYFSNDLFDYTGKVREPFEELSNIFTPEGLHIKNLMKRFDRVSGAATVGGLRFLHLQADGGTLIVVPAPTGILVVTIGGPEMNVGLARLEMLRAVEVVE